MSDQYRRKGVRGKRKAEITTDMPLFAGLIFTFCGSLFIAQAGLNFATFPGWTVSTAMSSFSFNISCEPTSSTLSPFHFPGGLLQASRVQGTHTCDMFC